MIQRRLALAFLPLLLATASPVLHAQAYPAKPVRVIVPFAPGGPADVLARVTGQELADALGQPFVVENKVGAAGNIGVEQIAKAMPDGYTVGIVPVGNVAVNPSLFPTLPYKASDLAPVVMLATVENVLVVNADVPAKSLKELIALAKQKPGTLSFASPGAGSQAHLAGELMALEADLKLIHVPYKGIGPALNDVVGGQVSMMFGAMSAVLPHVKSGKLRALGVASLKRSAAMPDLPTVAEQGLPKFEAVSWYALMAPAGTPAAIVDRLNAEAARSLAKPAIQEKFAAQGLEPGGGKPQELAASIRSETARWSEVIRKQNIKPD
ncbi:Bug family tripartite tricarboxylate transporter substrate binding protein [Variovorax sp. JS1663]|uniref:Bug family tripartite tricarboxylate transporter substrate binding protein n=1 Tax=Variovorax sp. JS1663 TaxID=1851577 RepID=UPI000B341A24|nr:tripartite tricarboxylate transporter substrate binding protein [Variovorax sp. JS1663]OUM02123.1 LacI family transcriptional regulator [Variovorax sp. JS1663]